MSMRLIFFFIIISGLGKQSFSQINSTRMNLIGHYLELEKYENEHTFYVDTIIKINDYSLYGVTPFTSSYSFCVIFKNDSILKNSPFPINMNKMPYSFNTYSCGEKKYISTYWYGDGTTSSSINLYLIEIKSDEIRNVYTGPIYLENKKTNKITDINSYTIITDEYELIVRKFSNDQKNLKELVRRFELSVEIPKTEQVSEKEFRIF